ncbi:MAG: hypothetical protein HY821_09610 [Acidobacteria bacterium]|nr:hypothetical protein [Acidobacteriota bacterium]
MLAAGAGFGEDSTSGAAAEYLGGTLSSLPAGAQGALSTQDPISFIFHNKATAVRVPYERINLIEYGLQVDRRVWESIVISPLMMLAKKRAHFLAVGYEGDDGKQQAMLFRVEKGSIRAVLVSLEARTGRKVTFMDEEARKAGKG